MKMRALRFLCVLCSLLVRAHALDREAFTFTNYDLDVHIESDQQRLAVRGKITLRNDSTSPQRNLTVQISSSLDWRSVQLDGKPVQFISQPYTSDIDHTGALSEAIVTLPREVSAKGIVEWEIGYEGIIALDATRLTRIGLPEERARHSDWDQIGKSFAAVRGIGYVVWYPVATESANCVLIQGERKECPSQAPMSNNPKRGKASPWPCVFGFKSNVANAGLRVRELNAEMSVEIAIVMANCRKN